MLCSHALLLDHASSNHKVIPFHRPTHISMMPIADATFAMFNNTTFRSSDGVVLLCRYGVCVVARYTSLAKMLAITSCPINVMHRKHLGLYRSTNYSSPSTPSTCRSTALGGQIDCTESRFGRQHGKQPAAITTTLHLYRGY